MTLKQFNIFLGDTNIKELFTSQQIENILKLSIKDIKELGFKIKKKENNFCNFWQNKSIKGGLQNAETN